MGESSEEEFEETQEMKDDKGKKTPGLQVKSSIKDEDELSFPDLEERAPLSEGEIKKIFETIGGLHRKYQVTFKDDSLSDLEKTKRLKKIQDRIARWEQMIAGSYERLLPGSGEAAAAAAAAAVAAAAAAPGEEGGSEVRVPGISALPLPGASRTPRQRGNVIGGVYQNNTPIRPQSVSGLSRRRQGRSAGSAIVPAAAGTAADPVILDEEGLELLKSQLGLRPLEFKFNELSIDEAGDATLMEGLRAGKTVGVDGQTAINPEIKLSDDDRNYMRFYPDYTGNEAIAEYLASALAQASFFNVSQTAFKLAIFNKIGSPWKSYLYSLNPSGPICNRMTCKEYVQEILQVLDPVHEKRLKYAAYLNKVQGEKEQLNLYLRQKHQLYLASTVVEKRDMRVFVQDAIAGMRNREFRRELRRILMYRESLNTSDTEPTFAELLSCAKRVQLLFNEQLLSNEIDNSDVVGCTLDDQFTAGNFADDFGGKVAAVDRDSDGTSCDTSDDELLALFNRFENKSKKSNKCFFCSELGHFARECPRKKKKIFRKSIKSNDSSRKTTFGGARPRNNNYRKTNRTYSSPGKRDVKRMPNAKRFIKPKHVQALDEISSATSASEEELETVNQVVQQPKKVKNYESEYRRLKELVCNLVDPTLDLESQECEKDFLDQATGGKGHL